MANILDMWNVGTPAAMENKSDQALFNVASRGNTSRVLELLSEGKADPGVLINGFNCLHSSSKKGHLAVVQALLRFKPSLCLSRTSDNRTAAMIASYEGHVEVAKVLDGYTVLCAATSALKISAASTSITVTACSMTGQVNHDDDLVDNNGNSAYLYACWGGQIDIVRYYIEEREKCCLELAADIAATTESATSAAVDTNFMSQVASVIELLPALLSNIKVKPTSQNKEGLTGIDMAASANHTAVIEYLNSKIMELQSISLGTENESATNSTSASTSKSESSGTGFSSAHRAAQRGAVEAFVQLCACGNAVDVCTSVASNGYTPLHVACLNSHLDIVNFILSTFASSLPTASASASASASAASVGSMSSLINAVSHTGMTPLHLACVSGSTAIVKVLLQAGADPWILNESGAGAIHLAAGNGKHEICQLLCKIPHIPILTCDDEGNTPIDAALGTGYRQLACQLAGFDLVQLRSERMLENLLHIIEDPGFIF